MPTIHNFSEALESLKEGKAIQRVEWYERKIFIKLQYPDMNSKMTLPYLYVEYPNGDRYPWALGQKDIMSEDWIIY